ncbi:hypothetical protein NLX86_14975 [Streptomyces sp. A3M-1-3]|uniref:hypothetical protein n=1 Tax=Streptomyces sp. A3M-1-3 TaxID=2962044 RepID=UPI0020B872DF|nr:hypothetical protein [Streptomyces sp. A3M-1-3]MCP3819359.1 hypothetical protein [Streptomyces sp. A3M-1-3]
MAVLLCTDDDMVQESSTTVVKAFTEAAGVSVPNLPENEVAAAGPSPCRTVEMSRETFETLVPQLAELPGLAQVTKTDGEDRGLLSGESGQPDSFAVVVSNCLPRAAGRYRAHLVLVL